MPRKSFALDNYTRLSETHKMKLIGNAPRYVTEPTTWQCEVCGRYHQKSYNAIRHHSPCVCRTSITLKKSDYLLLSSKLGITWMGEYPATNKIKINWSTKSGKVFKASYHELAYSKIPKRLMEYINE